MAEYDFPSDRQAEGRYYLCSNQKARLCAFLEHGEIEISNNQVENAIRPA
ncbi:MAG: transposase [Clostridiales bacterium]|nr:transposase [Clostridiales bacterium]